MSLGMVLHGVRDYLRDQYNWDHKTCGVQHECKPPATAGQFYVALDDAGVETAGEDNDYLQEVFNLEIGIWRRPGAKPADRLGHLKLPDDIYLANILTLSDLERQIIVPNENANTGGLHQNWGLWTYINTLFVLPSEALGPGFTDRLVFRGFGRMEGCVLPDSQQTTFFGRKLRFRGLKRTQNLRGSNATTG